jgi:integrase
MGTVYSRKRSPYLWIKYYQHGRPMRESTGTKNEVVARRMLRAREGDVERGIPIDHVTGWRINSEVLPLQWRQVDLRVGEVRLDPGTTKNREGRVFYLTPELHQLLKEQRAAADDIQRQKKMIVRHVFFHRSVTKAGILGHWTGHGISEHGFYHAWRQARTAAGCPGSIPHDFRRTAIRNMVRAGIPERVAMKLSGHKTRSVFDRYNVVSDGDLRDAASRLGHTGGHTSPSVAVFGNANPQNP